jgi:hypothetical protein
VCSSLLLFFYLTSLSSQAFYDREEPGAAMQGEGDDGGAATKE